ncbi:MAG: hypothetical protein IKE20_00535 [Eggerthellaceae bacterium]|nr:hypothetical protein [Eggerthellaceae bacterium]
MDKEIIRTKFERGKQLALKWSTFAFEEGYDLMEMMFAADGISESVERYAALKAAFGDDAEAVVEAMQRIAVEKTIEEAEEAINGD